MPCAPGRLGALFVHRQNHELSEKNKELQKVTARAVSAEKEAKSAEKEAKNDLAELCSSFGLAASRQGEYAQALLLFARAVELAAGDPPAEELYRIRVANWMRYVAEPIRTFTVPDFKFFQNHFRVFQFHPGGRYLLTQTDADRCDVWDVESGTAIPLPGGQRPIAATAWSQDGQRLAMGTAKGAVSVFTFPAGEDPERFDAGRSIRVLAFSPDGRYLACGGRHGARVWDLSDRSWATPLLGHPDEVAGLSFNAQGDRLVTACRDGRARIFAVPGGAGPVADGIPHAFFDYGVSHGGHDVGTPRFVDGGRALTYRRGGR